MVDTYVVMVVVMMSNSNRCSAEVEAHRYLSTLVDGSYDCRLLLSDMPHRNASLPNTNGKDLDNRLQFERYRALVECEVNGCMTTKTSIK
jgi:hypothetical protein